MNPSEYSKMYELEDRYWWFVGRRTSALGLLQRHLSKDRPLVLDLGCGTGVVSEAMQSLAETTGLDFSDHALKFSAERGLPRLVRGDATHMPLASNHFDAIIALDVFEHIEDDEAAFREAFRVLSPGGILVLSVPAFKLLWGPHDVALHHFRRYRKPEVVTKLERAGFQVTQSSYSVFVLFPLVVLSRILEKMRPGPPHASLPSVPSWLNQWLIALQQAEGRWISERQKTLPWGSSVLAVAKKIK